MRKSNSERGMSLVEATIILLVLSVLTAVIAPSVGDYMNDARQVKAKEDVEALGTGILRLLRDVGTKCLLTDGRIQPTGAGCTKANRVDLLLSAGATPLGIGTAASDVTIDADAGTDATVNWSATGATAATQTDTMDHQLVDNGNTNAYPHASFTAGGGPRSGLGWRGAYVTGPISGDPWGRTYEANTIFLAVASDANDGAGSPDHTTEGLKRGGWNRDVLVLSAGQNGIVDTAFGATAASATGDDVIYVLRGSTK